MRPHLRYLKYVLLHKFYVFRAGLAIRALYGPAMPSTRIAWVWRLLVHDRSKFGRHEWTPYVVNFYAAPSNDPAVTRARKAAFDAAWLHHIHANPHHWQHHVLHEDSGKTKVLIPHAVLVYEMVADWIGAGPKVFRSHTMAEAVAETIVWYAANHKQQMMREIVRDTAESILLALAERYGVQQAAAEIASAERARVSLVIPR